MWGGGETRKARECLRGGGGCGGAVWGGKARAEHRARGCQMDDRVRSVFRAEARYLRCRAEVAIAEGEGAGAADPKHLAHAHRLLERARAHLDATCGVLRESLSGWAGPATTEPERAAAFLRLLLKHRSAKERIDLLELARSTDAFAQRIPGLSRPPPIAAALEDPLLREVLGLLAESPPPTHAAQPAGGAGGTG